MLSLAILAPVVAIAVLLRPGADRSSDGRKIAAAALAVSLLCAIAAAWTVHGGGLAADGIFEIDGFGAVPMVLFAGLALVTSAALPRRDCSAGAMAGLLAIAAGTMAAYASPSLPLFCASWAITLVPFVAGWFPDGNGAPGRTAGLAGVALLAGACAAGGSWPGFVLLTSAALLRKGVFPFHSWVVMAFEEGSAPVLTLFLNGHLGAFALAKFGLKLFPAESREALGLISALALLTAVYTAVLAIAEKSTPRLLALLAVSQASFILAGLESRNHEGIAGAAIHWMVVAAATTGMSLVYRLAQVRCPEAVNPSGYLGLAARMPRLCGLLRDLRTRTRRASRHARIRGRGPAVSRSARVEPDARVGASARHRHQRDHDPSSARASIPGPSRELGSGGSRRSSAGALGFDGMLGIPDRRGAVARRRHRASGIRRRGNRRDVGALPRGPLSSGLNW